MPSNARLSTYRTAVIQNANELIVRYVATDIVRADAETITLNSGGWRTVTTKRKMVQAANQFGLGFHVFQHKGEWFVSRRGAPAVPFHDGMTFPRGLVEAA